MVLQIVNYSELFAFIMNFARIILLKLEAVKLKRSKLC